MKRILYLSFYFEPDLCAGSFRNTPLAKELSKQVSEFATVDVITTIPNRYHSFSADAPNEEIADNLFISRIQLPSHKSGFLDQVFAFVTYYRSVKQITANQQYDLVFASSSRLFTAFLGYLIAKKKSVPLILDIRDIFTDTLSDVIKNRFLKQLLLPVFLYFERKTFTYASHINLISGGFSTYFSKYPSPTYSFFTNGIDTDFVHQETYAECLLADPITITYAGNIGEGQGLHKIIPQAASILGNRYLFRIIGDGGAKSALNSELLRNNITNVIIEPPMRRNELVEVYKQSHYLFLHLNDYNAFKKVLPSKIFELAAFPRPVIAGVSGYAREFIREHVENAILFDPTDVNSLVTQLQKNQYLLLYRKSFVQKFLREKINTQFSSLIISYL